MSQTRSVSSLWQKTSDVSLFLFQQQRRLDLLTITNPGEYVYFGLCACMRVCYSLHSTPHNNIVYLQGPSQTGLCSKRASHGWDEGALWLLLLLTTSISCTPRAKTKPFLATRQHFRDPIVAPRACLSQSSGYSLCFCVSMGSWMFPQCIWVKAKTAFRAAFRETDGVARKDAAPICLKYLAALIYFD